MAAVRWSPSTAPGRHRGVTTINVKIRDGKVANRPIYVALAVTVDGTRDILGLWAGDGGEGAKFWFGVCTELKNRGVEDVLMAVCDGLTGLPDAINTVWPQTVVQTCVVHLLRNSFKYASRQHWDAIAKALKPVYTAATEAAATERFLEFAEAWGSRYPAIVRLWENAWAGSSGALPRRSPLRTGRASRPRIRLKQTQGCRGVRQRGVVRVRCAARPCGRSECARGVKRADRSVSRPAGRRLSPDGGSPTGPR